MRFEKASLTNGDGPALSADCITIDRSMKCSEVCAHGEISLVRARIVGTLTFCDATLSKADGPAINLRQSHAATLELSPLAQPAAEVDLTYAHFGVLVDDPDCGPRKAKLHGLVYDALHERRGSQCRSRGD